jgi:hypothetical protein
VFGLLALGFMAFVMIAVLGAVLGLASLLVWFVMLPFRLLGFVFKALGALLFLPLFLLLGLVICAVVGLPLLLALLPALPIALLVLAVWWLARRGAHPAAPAR